MTELHWNYYYKRVRNKAPQQHGNERSPGGEQEYEVSGLGLLLGHTQRKLPMSSARQRHLKNSFPGQGGADPMDLSSA
jgi:hypothetical protein